MSSPHVGGMMFVLLSMCVLTLVFFSSVHNHDGPTYTATFSVAVDANDTTDHALLGTPTESGSGNSTYLVTLSFTNLGTHNLSVVGVSYPQVWLHTVVFVSADPTFGAAVVVPNATVEISLVFDVSNLGGSITVPVAIALATVR